MFNNLLDPLLMDTQSDRNNLPVDYFGTNFLWMKIDLFIKIIFQSRERGVVQGLFLPPFMVQSKHKIATWSANICTCRQPKCEWLKSPISQKKHKNIQSNQKNKETCHQIARNKIKKFEYWVNFYFKILSKIKKVKFILYEGNQKFEALSPKILARGKWSSIPLLFCCMHNN